MTNLLTGDFAAVLEVSGSTLNRLLATIHQSTPTQPARLPHSAFLRLGDHQPVDGVRGSARGQVSVPQVELLNGSDDRVAFRTWLRVWYKPDAASTPLPEFVYGEMRAEYGIQVKEVPESPRTPRGGTYAFLGVIPGSVSFTSSGPTRSADTRIAKQLEHLLAGFYDPSPSPVIQDFLHHRFRSLVDPAGEGAVAHPLDLGGASASGAITSVSRVFLAGNDFAVAVSKEYVMSLLDGPLGNLRSLQPSFTVTVKALGFTVFSATYTVTINSATAQWSAGSIILTIKGKATTGSWAPNADFTITQTLDLSFDPTTETLSVSQAGAPSVSVNVHGPFGGAIEGDARDAVTNAFNTALGNALYQIQPEVQSATQQKQKLISQLQTLDGQANARLEGAEFTPDGIILRGSVSLAPREHFEISYRKLSDDTGVTAFFTWIPGGHVMEYLWRWDFDAPPGPPGSHTDPNTFLLRNTTWLPGLPPPPYISQPAIGGTICLGIRGVVVDEVTGVEKPVVVQPGQTECVPLSA